MLEKPPGPGSKTPSKEKKTAPKSSKSVVANPNDGPIDTIATKKEPRAMMPLEKYEKNPCFFVDVFILIPSS